MRYQTIRERFLEYESKKVYCVEMERELSFLVFYNLNTNRSLRNSRSVYVRKVSNLKN